MHVYLWVLRNKTVCADWSPKEGPHIPINSKVLFWHIQAKEVEEIVNFQRWDLSCTSSKSKKLLMKILARYQLLD